MRHAGMLFSTAQANCAFLRFVEAMRFKLNTTKRQIFVGFCQGKYTL